MRGSIRRRNGRYYITYDRPSVWDETKGRRRRNQKSVQRQLRHASAKITLDTYGHLLPDAPQQAALLLDASIFGTTIEQGATSA
jgi:integrase